MTINQTSENEYSIFHNGKSIGTVALLNNLSAENVDAIYRELQW